MQNKKQKVALSSVVASFLLTLMKLIVGVLTGSMGIISEAAHSGLDLIAASITYWAVRVSHRPADPDHPYGHGKIENISALAETLLLFATSGWIIFEAVNRLIKGRVEIEIAWYSFAVMIISIVVDFTRSRALDRIAKQTNSQALEADALHFRSDIYSSMVVIAGLIFVLLGIPGADSLAAIGVALFVVFVSYKLGKRTIDVLVDTAPKELTEKIRKTILKTEGVVDLERLRVRPTGLAYFVDMVVDISRKIPLEGTNKITKTIEKNVKGVIPDADVVIHIKPVALKDETITEQLQIIAANQAVSIHKISIQTIKNKKYVSFDLEVERNLKLNSANEKAVKFEEIIHKELGQDIDVNIHVEPIEQAIVSGKQADSALMQAIYNAANEIKVQVGLKEIHDITARKSNKKIFITMRCVLNKNVPLEKAHQISEQIENFMRDKIPNIEQIVIRMES